LLYMLFYVLFVCKCVLPPGDNPIAVNKYIIYLTDFHYGDLVSTPDFLLLLPFLRLSIIPPIFRTTVSLTFWHQSFTFKF
jgi:hypothetical protein